MNSNLDKLMIYCTYHKDEQIDEHNLNNIPNYITLFKGNDITIEGDNINHLNKYFCEICTIYYVWKNELYLNYDYVGFCHYRRFFNNINLYLCYHNLYNSINLSDLDNLDDIFPEFDFDMKNSLYEYLLSLNRFDQRFLYKYFNNLNVKYNIPGALSYILKNDMFNDLCNIAFGFLNTIWPNWDTQNEEYYEAYLKEHLHNYENIKNFTINRFYATSCELIFGIILSIITNCKTSLYNNNVCEESKINIIVKDKVYDNIQSSFEDNQLLKFYNKNVKITPNIYIQTDKFKYVKVFYNVFYNTFQLCDVAEDFNNSIELSINEYIDSKDPLSFIDNNYTIKQIN